METGKKIQILLSTYNGQEFLRPQLESYIALENFSQVKVLIRDDGSTDQTGMILREYQEKYGFDVIFGENIGVNASYFALLEASDPSCDFFAFSDQDDVWLPEKFLLAISYLTGEPQEKPLLFASISHIVDQDLKHMGFSVFPRGGISYYNAMVQNVTPGHTQVFNRVMRDLLLEHDRQGVYIIDWWLYLVASALGKVLFSRTPTVLHRQHGVNAVGYKVRFWEKTFQRLRRLKNGVGNTISLQLYSFWKSYSAKMPQPYREETERMLFSQAKVSSRLKYALTGKAYRNNLFETCLFRLLYLAGKYKL